MPSSLPHVRPSPRTPRQDPALLLHWGRDGGRGIEEHFPFLQTHSQSWGGWYKGLTCGTTASQQTQEHGMGVKQPGDQDPTGSRQHRMRLLYIPGTTAGERLG